MVTERLRLGCPASHCCGAGDDFGSFHCRLQKQCDCRVSLSRTLDHTPGSELPQPDSQQLAGRPHCAVTVSACFAAPMTRKRSGVLPILIPCPGSGFGLNRTAAWPGTSLKLRLDVPMSFLLGCPLHSELVGQWRLIEAPDASQGARAPCTPDRRAGQSAPERSATRTGRRPFRRGRCGYAPSPPSP